MAIDFEVAGKTAVITGGSRGIGAMIARGFVEGGANVIITARSAKECEETAHELNQLNRGIAIPIAADLSTEQGLAYLSQQVATTYPVLDILINNAGATWGAPLGEFPRHGFDKVLNLNVTALFELTQKLLPLLRAAARPARPSRIINIGSREGMSISTSDNYSYVASKAAVHMLTRKLAASLAPEHITVNAIAPGLFPTKMTAFKLAATELADEAIAEIPLGRVGSPDDIAAAAIFLSSPASSYLTGVVLPVDGGRTGAR